VYDPVNLALRPSDEAIEASRYPVVDTSHRSILRKGFAG
jgi:hypothetical protein